MASSMIRQALGAMKDQTSIGIAKVVGTSSFPNLDVLVVKTTSHEESPAEDRHIREVSRIVSASPSAACCCVAAIARRLSKTRNWVVALKSLILLHELLRRGAGTTEDDSGGEGERDRREGDGYFEEEAAMASQRGCLFSATASFKDEARSSAWDLSAFVRGYTAFLTERLDFVGEDHRLRRRRGGKTAVVAGGDRKEDGEHASESEGEGDGVFDRMPLLQRLLGLVVACRPAGAAKQHQLVRAALRLVVRESFVLYADVCRGVTALLDRFVILRHGIGRGGGGNGKPEDALKALDIFTRAAKQADELAAFYEMCRRVGVSAGGDYITVQRIPPEHLDTLRNIINKTSPFHSPSPSPSPSLSSQALERNISLSPLPSTVPSPHSVESTYSTNLVDLDKPLSAQEREHHLALALFVPISSATATITQQWEPFPATTPVTTPVPAPTAPTTTTAAAAAATTATATATGGSSGWELTALQPLPNNSSLAGSTTSGWELAISQPSAPTNSTLAGGFDRFLLDNLYEQAEARQKSAPVARGSASSLVAFVPNAAKPLLLALPAPPGTAATNPVLDDPFAASACIPPPAYVQMEEMKRKQALLLQEQQQWQLYQSSGLRGYNGFANATYYNTQYNTAATVNPTFTNYMAMDTSSPYSTYPTAYH